MYSIKLRNGLTIQGYSLIEAMVKFRRYGVVVAVLCCGRVVAPRK